MPETLAKRPKMGKLASWRFFSSNSSIRSVLPPTEMLSLNSLKSFLSKYRTVYIKPNYGYQGRGVIKAWKTRNGYAYIRERGLAVTCSSLNRLYRKVKGAKRQIIQRGIPVARVNGRSFDIRLLMMRNEAGDWQYAGMLAKVAGKGWVITNKRSHGYVLTVEDALERSLNFNHQQIEDLKYELKSLCHAACEQLDKYKKYRQIGFDIAVDKRGNVWMIEANTAPGWSLFRQLKDNTMYTQIRRILRARK